MKSKYKATDTGSLIVQPHLTRVLFTKCLVSKG